MSKAAARVRHRCYSPKPAEIVRLRLAKNWKPETLAAKADVSRKTLTRLEDGEKAFLYTLTRVAKALGVHPSKIAAGVPPDDAPAETLPKESITITVTLTLPLHLFDEVRGPLLLQAELKKSCGLSGHFEVNGVGNGSTRIEFVGTEEDWSRLVAAVEAGQLSHIPIERISREPGGQEYVSRNPRSRRDWRVVEPGMESAAWESLDEGQPEPNSAEQAGPSSRPKTFWRVDNFCRATALVSVLCAVSGILPIYARNVYFIGIVLVATTAMVAAKYGADKWSRRYLPAIALIMNLCATIFWPWCIGFENTPQGYRFGLVNRDPAWMQPPTER